MGEMADYALEGVYDFEERRIDYWRGELSYEDAVMNGVVDEQGWEILPNSGYAEPSRVCRCCGEGGLYWDRAGGKFLLHKEGKIHKCTSNPYNKAFNRRKSDT